MEKVTYREFIDRVRFYLADVEEPFLWTDLDILRALGTVLVDLRNSFIDLARLFRLYGIGKVDEFIETVKLYESGELTDEDIKEMELVLPYGFTELVLYGVLGHLYLKDDSEVFVERANYYRGLYEQRKLLLRKDIVRNTNVSVVSRVVRGLL
ncbi:MAG: hypothetical protein QXT86_08945 [Archaeoglobaceae archaeon]